MNDASSAWVNTAFTLIYAVAGIPLGRLSDTWKRTRVIAIGVTLWSVMTATSGLAIGYWTYLLTRMGVGIGEASCAPAGQALIGDLYPAERRARAMGIFMMGLPLGLFASYLLSGVIAEAWGWRAAFFVACVPGLILAVLALRIREPARGASDAHRAGRAACTGRIRGRVRRDPSRPDDVVDHPFGNPVQLPRVRGEHVPERVPAALPRDRARRREQAVGRLARLGRRDRLARRRRARRSPAHEDGERPVGGRRGRDAARRALHLHRAGTAEGQCRRVHVPDGSIERVHVRVLRDCLQRDSGCRSAAPARARQFRCTSSRSMCWARASVRPSWAH